MSELMSERVVQALYVCLFIFLLQLLTFTSHDPLPSKSLTKPLKWVPNISCLLAFRRIFC